MALVLSEFYTSLAGETSWAGLPCTFVRLAGCNLHCAWCDTPHARRGGESVRVEELAAMVSRSGTKLVCITGGEPLLQEETPALARKLLRAGHSVLVETNGSLSIEPVPRRAHRIVDVKPPSSGEVNSFLVKNLRLLTARDELKFVVADMRDFEWAVEFVKENAVAGRCGLLVSPAWLRGTKPSYRREFMRELARRVLSCGVPFRYNIQLHKVIWGAGRREV